MNGEKTLTVKFPTAVLEQYKAKLGKEYNLVVKDTPITAILEGDTANGDKNNASETKYPHLYDEDKVSKEYLNSVNSDIENAIINIRNGNTNSVPEVIGVAKLNENTIQAISNFVGFDISGYTCKIERDRLVHIESRHGINGEHDHSLSDPKDTARIGYVINNSDNIEWTVDGNGNRVYDAKYNDRHNKNVPVFVMEKRIDGTYSISQVVPDSKKKTLWITSARIEKADVGSQVPNNSIAIPQPTSETPLNSSPASNDTISQNNAGVNSDESKTPYEIMDDFGLTYDEQHAILEYKSSGSYTLNDDLRNGETLSPAEETQKKNANSALDKFPKYTGVAYRNIGFPTAKKFIAFLDEHIGKTSITYPAFTSASKSIDGYTVEAPYTAHYEIESTNGRDVSAIGIEAEKEILFKTDTSFEFSIIEQTDNYISLKMKEVTGNGESKPYGAFQDRGERPTAGRNATGFDNSGERKKVYTGIDTVRGRSSVYDEIYNGAPISDGRRVESGSKPQDLGNNAEIRNDGERERLLSGVNISSSDSIISAVHSTLKPEISGNTALMNALINKFGGDGISGLASEIEAYYGKNNTLDDFESLFTDGGKSVYEALGGNGLEDIKYSESESEELSNGQAGNNLLSGNSGRTIDESAGEQAERISSYKQKIRGKATSERKITARELALKG